MDAADDFDAYMAGRWPALVRAAVLLGCSPHDAEDIAQTALARCFRSWAKVARADNRDAYVYRVLVNSLADSRRRRWWGERPTAQLPEPAGTVHPQEAADRADAVDRALDDLEPTARAVVVLRFYADLTEAQTAAVLGIPVGTVKSRQSRALRELASNRHLAEGSDRRPR